MINSEISTIEHGNSVVGATTSHKQPVLAKKVALRDVQNNKSNLIHKTRQENLLPVDGKPFVDAAKACGTKRLTPDHTSPPLNGENELFNHARRKYEHERNKGRNLGNMERFVGFTQSANFSHIQKEIIPKLSQINGKNMHYGSLVAPKQTVSKTIVPRPKVEVSQFNESKDEQRTERFIRLQNFIKHCDSTNHNETIQLLLHLSPSELSSHAFDLETRAIQLTIEEGKEMQRMKALNILGKPSTTRNPTPITQHVQHKN